MYLLIVHGNNAIHWAKSYCELEKLHKSANKWSEILGGQTFPYSFLDLVNEFYGENWVDKITMDANDDGYMISIMRDGDVV